MLGLEKNWDLFEQKHLERLKKIVKIYIETHSKQ